MLEGLELAVIVLLMRLTTSSTVQCTMLEVVWSNGTSYSHPFPALIYSRTGDASSRHFVTSATCTNNNNNNQDDIYSAVIMTEVIARVHSVHLMNVEQRQVAADPQTKPNWAVSLHVGCLHLQPPSPFIIIAQPKSLYSFTVPQRVIGWVDLAQIDKALAFIHAVPHQLSYYLSPVLLGKEAELAKAHFKLATRPRLTRRMSNPWPVSYDTSHTVQ